MEDIKIEYLIDSTDAFEESVSSITDRTKNQKRKAINEIKTSEPKRTRNVDKNDNNTSVSGM